MDASARARPRFKSCLRPVIDSDGGLFVLGEAKDCWIPSPAHAAVAELLDGAHDLDAIFGRLSPRYSSATVFAALDDLRSRGFLAEDTAEAPPAVRAFWEQAGVAPGLAMSRIARTPVAIRVIGGAEADGLPAMLARQGLTVADEGEVTLVVADDCLHPDLAAWNAHALETGRSWLLVKPSGTETWIGPAFAPGKTACWECLAHRLRWHRRIKTYAAERQEFEGAQPAALPVSRDAALAEAATEIARWIGVGGASALADRVVATNLLTFERTSHPLVRRPQCPACGCAAPADGAQAQPVALRPRSKLATSDGGHRSADPQTTARRLERHLSPITGIVGALEAGDRTGPSDGDDWLTPTYAADHNFSDMHDPRFVLREGMRRRSGGKGRTAAQARISALAESLERYCGVFDGTEPRLRAAYADLGDAAMRPNDVMGYSDRQFAERDRANLREHKAHWVPEPFREDARIDWTPLWSLTDERTRFLPTSLCYFGYRGDGPVFGRGDSNGCAAGAAPEEAILQGFLELVERDAVALWWYNRIPRPAVDLKTADPYAVRLVEHYRGLSRELWALDLTSDLGIPVFAALSRRVDKPEEDVIYGFGCHLDPAIALSRALTEINQSLEAVPSATGPASALTYLGGEEAVDWWRNVRVRDNAWLVADPAAAPVRPGGVPTLATDDLAEDVRFCVERARARGIEVLVLDQTRPDVDFPVVRVVAPGLRHFWARFGPGRLYDVPVRMGWLPRPREEAELNQRVVQF